MTSSAPVVTLLNHIDMSFNFNHYREPQVKHTANTRPPNQNHLPLLTFKN